MITKKYKRTKKLSKKFRQKKTKVLRGGQCPPKFGRSGGPSGPNYKKGPSPYEGRKPFAAQISERRIAAQKVRIEEHKLAKAAQAAAAAADAQAKAAQKSQLPEIKTSADLNKLLKNLGTQPDYLTVGPSGSSESSGYMQVSA